MKHRFSIGPRFVHFMLGSVAACVVALTFVPVKASAHADAKADGAQVFADSGCQHCHGAAGEGTKKGPSLLDERHRMNAEQIKAQIKDGGKSMPAFGDSLDDAQLESLVKLLRAKKWPPIPPATPS